MVKALVSLASQEFANTVNKTKHNENKFSNQLFFIIFLPSILRLNKKKKIKNSKNFLSFLKIYILLI